ncbi:hypothetical protein LCGC14_1832910 [marine sediment metagenome]|uniref:Uncharacterized protein n=1 Tax=marine sediment metagenome TaxID=412755 RepID=A0A0F9H3L0_9ZZZZ
MAKKTTKETKKTVRKPVVKKPEPSVPHDPIVRKQLSR